MCGYTESASHSAEGNEYAYDENGHWQVCDTCEAKFNSEEHTFGKWVLTEEGHVRTCTVCDYTETVEHAYVEGEYTSDETSHWQICEACQEATEHEEHTFSDWQANTDDATFDGHFRTCEVCGYIERAAHEADEEHYTHDEEGHWHICEICEAPAAVEQHIFGDWTYTEDGHTRICTVCGYAENVLHASEEYAFDTESHWYACDKCGIIFGTENHTMGEWADAEDMDGYEARTCSACGYVEFKAKAITSEDAAAMVQEATENNSKTITLTVPTATESGEEPGEENSEPASTSIAFDADTINAIADAVNDSETVESVTIVVDESTAVEYNSEVLNAIADALEEAGPGASLQFSIGVCDTDTARESEDGTGADGGLTDEQKDAIEAEDDKAVVYHIALEIVDGEGDKTELKNFGSATAKATITVPYNETVEEGMRVIVSRIETDGTLPKMVDASYDEETKAVKWSTPSHSYYMISQEEIPATPTPTPTPTPSHSSSGSSSGSSTYAVSSKVDGNGKVTLSSQRAKANAEVKITVTPDEGYALKSLVAKNSSGKELVVTEKDGTYSFKMPYSKVTVEAVFEKAAEEPTDEPEQIEPTEPKAPIFEDVAADAYYFDAVNWAYRNEITLGTSETTFSPDDACTRAQGFTFLYRAAGCPDVSDVVLPFIDVLPNAYYADAVRWAYKNGITTGTSDTTFTPDAFLSRQEIVAMMYRLYAKGDYEGVYTYSDVTSDMWSYDAIMWATQAEITNGVGDGMFAPAAICSRAQIVTFLYRAF